MKIKEYFVMAIILGGVISGFGYIIGDLTSSYSEMNKQNVSSVSTLEESYNAMRKFRSGKIISFKKIFGLGKMFLNYFNLINSMVTSIFQITHLPGWIQTTVTSLVLAFIGFAVLEIVKDFLPFI